MNDPHLPLPWDDVPPPVEPAWRPTVVPAGPEFAPLSDEDLDAYDTSFDEAAALAVGGADEPVPLDELPHPDDLPALTRVVDLDAPISEHLTEGLNPEQAAAVGCLAGPLLVVAGPGSGKTRVLTHRVAALLDVGVAPWQILAVTFTNKAAGEMRGRLETMVGAATAKDLWVATFHSMCVRLLRANHEAAGLPRDFTIVDADDAAKLIGRALERKGEKLDRKELRGLQQDVSRAKNQGKSVAQLASSGAPGDRVLADIWHRYEQELARVGGADFDDLLLRTMRMLEEHPQVTERYQRKFSHILVDEYQDTNPVQYRIVQLLAQEHRNLMVVGDLDQAIYAFRSATPELMERFAEDWPGARVITLDRNYRSTQAILETVRAVIAPNPAAHRPKLLAVNAKGDPVRVYAARDDRDEASWVVGQIAGTSASLAGHAILVRTHAQTRVIEEALKQRGVPYEILGGLRFYDRAEVKDALAYLKLTVNPADFLSFTRAVATPKRGLGPAALAEVDELAIAQFDGDLLHACTQLGHGSSKKAAALDSFARLMTQLVAAAATSGPAGALKVIVDGSGLRDHVAKQDAGFDRVENLDELISSARGYVSDRDNVTVDGTPVPDLDPWQQTVAFLENVALVGAGDDADVSSGRVQVVTAHASKGKEWPHVWVMGVEEGMYPHVRSTTAAEKREERRLLFVACSRAETTLTLSYAQRRALFGGQPDACLPSPFLSDLPDSVETITSSRPDRSWGASGGFASNVGRGGYQKRSAAVRARPVAQAPKPAAASRPVAKPAARPSAPEPDLGDALCASDCYPGQIVRSAEFGLGTVEQVAYGLVAVKFKDGSVVKLEPAELTSL
jgi:DNA helicase II / ATP-dependent DNA helicase PcrA